MVYDSPENDKPIRQGDIFAGLPLIDISLKKIPVIINDQGEQDVLSWEDILKEGKPVTAILGLKPVTAIVASQDCDCSRVPDITLCEIRDFRNVERLSKDTNAPNKWVSIITQQARKNQKWFHLPPDPEIGFEIKMGVDFLVTLRVPRADLEDYKHLRKGCLDFIAKAHFRERIAEFYRRYPYDEWYPLDTEELKEYIKKYPLAQPFGWQRKSNGS